MLCPQSLNCFALTLANKVVIAHNTCLITSNLTPHPTVHLSIKAKLIAFPKQWTWGRTGHLGTNKQLLTYCDQKMKAHCSFAAAVCTAWSPCQICSLWVTARWFECQLGVPAILIVMFPFHPPPSQWHCCSWQTNTSWTDQADPNTARWPTRLLQLQIWLFPSSVRN